MHLFLWVLALSLQLLVLQAGTAIGLGVRTPHLLRRAYTRHTSRSVQDTRDALKTTHQERAAPEVGDPSSSQSTTICDIVDQGGATSSTLDVGPIIEQVFKSCVKRSSGAVLRVPPGDWPIASHVVMNPCKDFIFQMEGNLHLTVTNVGGGPIFDFRYSNNFRVTGGGTFFGNGRAFRDKYALNDRPRLMLFEGTKYEVDHIRLDDAPMYHLTVRGSHFKVHDIVISSKPPYVGTTDGIDSKSPFRQANVTSGDECLSIKKAHGVEVQDLECHNGGAVSIGSAGPDGTFEVEDVRVKDVSMHNSQAGVYIKAYPKSRGYIRGCLFQNFTIDNVAHPIEINQAWCGHGECTLSESGGLDISDITFDGFKGSGDDTTRPPVILRCHSGGCHDINFQNINLAKRGGRSPKPQIQGACGAGLAALPAC
ncbi:hypothetical protein CBOM_00760 [Ceraceosorus bombacis]|uniref:Uncharacterized protein n=1 Tax=Ceraceosorus bombacis TaxID=401625 RepID=A0A0P1BAQ0_9BASI|nr:hypothetical protein CBOM_00760 [Ceraceosorus bombacis]